MQTAARTEIHPFEVVRVHFAIGERLGLPMLVSRILALPREDRWQTMASAALRDDLHTVHAQLTAQLLAATEPEAEAADRVETWEAGDGEAITRAAQTFDEICSDETADLARMSVALRVVRSLLAAA